VLSLEGRRALVAGAASGIGRATAVCLAELGADLVLADREPLDAVRAEVGAAGRMALALHGDSTDEAFPATDHRDRPHISPSHMSPASSGVRKVLRRKKRSISSCTSMYAPPLILASALIEQMSGGIHCPGRINCGPLGCGPVRHGDGIRHLCRLEGGGTHVGPSAVAPRGREEHPCQWRGPGFGPHAAARLACDRTGRPPTMSNLAHVQLIRSELGWPIALLCFAHGFFHLPCAIVDVNGGSFIG